MNIVELAKVFIASFFAYQIAYVGIRIATFGYDYINPEKLKQGREAVHAYPKVEHISLPAGEIRGKFGYAVVDDPDSRLMDLVEADTQYHKGIANINRFKNIYWSLLTGIILTLIYMLVIIVVNNLARENFFLPFWNLLTIWSFTIGILIVYPNIKYIERLKELKKIQSANQESTPENVG